MILAYLAAEESRILARLAEIAELKEGAPMTKVTKTGYVNVRIEKSLKTKAERILKKMGVTPSMAISMLYQQVVLQNGIPFAICVPNATTIAAFKELEAGGGELYHGPSDEALAKILAEAD